MLVGVTHAKYRRIANGGGDLIESGQPDALKPPRPRERRRHVR